MTVCQKCNGKGKTTEYDGLRKFCCDYKCPACDGTGKVVHPMMSMNGDEYTGEWEQHKCEACNGTGEVEMTEQEYIQTCNTEQLVDAIFDCTMANSWNFNKNGIKRWLKQPHTKRYKL